MPAAYAHLMITEKALERFRDDQDIGERLRSIAINHSHFAQLSSVGPDYPYLDFFHPRQKDWAEHMHYRHTGDAIKSIANKLLDLGSHSLQKENFIISFCWILGFLSRVTGDLIIHPVVMNIVGPYDGNGRVHRHCPSDLNAEKFFSILEQYYPDKEIIEKVKRYPVIVALESHSYVLILCDEKSEFVLYKDLDRTITIIDYPYWREGKRVPCKE